MTRAERDGKPCQPCEKAKAFLTQNDIRFKDLTPTAQDHFGLRWPMIFKLDAAGNPKLLQGGRAQMMRDVTSYVKRKFARENPVLSAERTAAAKLQEADVKPTDKFFIFGHPQMKDNCPPCREIKELLTD